MGLTRALTILALVLAAVACAPQDPAARLARALDAMDRLAGFRFELVAEVTATGSEPLGGAVAERVRMVGEFSAPDRAHVAVQRGGARTDLLLAGRRTWIDAGDGYRQSVRTPVGPLRDARAPLAFLRGPAATSFAGLGLAQGNVTYRVRLTLSAGDLAARLAADRDVPPDARGVVEVELGLADDLVRRQAVLITSSLDGGGSGLDRTLTRYVVEYWALGLPQDVREPE